jgi:hypothetical protein
VCKEFHTSLGWSKILPAIGETNPDIPDLAMPIVQNSPLSDDFAMAT